MTRRHGSPPRPARAAPPSAPRATTSRSPPAALGAVSARAASPSDLCRRRGNGTRGSRDRSARHRRGSWGGCISLRACHHRVNDLRIPCTAAQIPCEPFAHTVPPTPFLLLQHLLPAPP